MPVSDGLPAPPAEDEADAEDPFGGPGGLEDAGAAKGPKRMH